MGGVSALLAAGPDQALVTAHFQESVEHHPLHAMLGQPGPEPGQHGRVKTGIGQFRADRVLPVDRADRHRGGLPVGQVLRELQHRDQRQHRRRQARRPTVSERLDERLIRKHLASKHFVIRVNLVDGANRPSLPSTVNGVPVEAVFVGEFEI